MLRPSETLPNDLSQCISNYRSQPRFGLVRLNNEDKNLRRPYMENFNTDLFKALVKDKNINDFLQIACRSYECSIKYCMIVL